MIKTIFYLASAISLLGSTTHAEDYKKTVIKTSLLFYPTGSPLRDQYIKSEKASGKVFETFHANQNISKELLDQFKKFCIKKHPFSMDHRLQELQIQLASYKTYYEAAWAEGLEDKEKNKIIAVAAALLGEDYEMRLLWAQQEADAFKRLSLLSLDTTAAQKRWPNSYQSQLQHALGISPGTQIPSKRPKNNVAIKFIQVKGNLR